jgi:hypothetical protein
VLVSRCGGNRAARGRRGATRGVTSAVIKTVVEHLCAGPIAGDDSAVKSSALLDHVSIAVPSGRPAWPLLRGDLGGAWASAGDADGFRFGTFRYVNGMQVELLEPHRPERNDFLARFLATHGPGVHHLTFKVPDLLAAVDAVNAAGFAVHSVRTDDPQWKEAFLHPKVVGGPVVQLSEYQPEPPPPAPRGLPDPTGPAAALRAVDVPVDDVNRAVALLAGLLGGHRSDDGTDGVGVTWPTIGTTLRLRPADAPARLVFTGVAPDTAHRRPDGRDPVLGVELTLAP